MELQKLASLGIVGLLLLACGPAATATPAPTRATAATATPTGTAAPVSATTGATPVSGSSAATPASASPTPRATPTPSAATASGPKNGGIARLWTAWDMQVWDIQKEPGAAYPMQFNSPAVFSKLTTFAWAQEGTCDNPLVMQSAESYAFKDPRTLDVTLRPGIRWHDKPPVNGREMTADDIVFNFNRLKKVGRSGNITPFVRLIDSIEALGPRTARFHFNEDFAFAPATLFASQSGPYLMAPEAGGTTPDKDYSDPYKSWIGTGPFIFKEWKPGVKTVFVKNPNYFEKGKPYLDELEILPIQDMATKNAAFLSGKLDVLMRVVPAQVSLFKSAYPQGRITGCAWFSGFAVFWPRVDQKPFDDVRVRRALSMAMDRQAILKSLFEGSGELLTIVPSTWGRFSLPPQNLPPEVGRYLEYRPEEAKKLLAEAGFPNGFKTTFEGFAGYGPLETAVQESFIGFAEKVGVKLDSKWYERGQFSRRALQGNHDGIGFTRASNGDPYVGLSDFHSKAGSGANRGHIIDPELDKLVTEYNGTFDLEKQIPLAHRIQERVVDQAWAIYSPSPLDFAVVPPYVKGFGEMSHISRLPTLYQNLWFDR